MISELVTPRHLSRKAVIYVRQSSPQQVLTNQESLRLQYALRQRAGDLGWNVDDIEVIDADLGLSGAGAEHRLGFKDLIARVTLGEVGIVLSYEVTRLARNCSDWYPLLDLCGYRQCLIGDRDGVYDPGSPNGRLLLGLKGTISEVELHTLRGRLTAGLLNKAQRGELSLLLPAGLTRDSAGTVTKDPNLEVQSRLGLVFSTFFEQGSITKVMRVFRGRGLELPRRCSSGDVIWTAPTVSAIRGILKNPAYAGAFVYGRTRTNGLPGQRRVTMLLPMPEWKVVVKDKYPAYIDWRSFERIQAILRDNHAEYSRKTSRGIPRNGTALLQGIAWCGACGHKITMQYKGGVRYICNTLHNTQNAPICQHLPARPIDERVTAAFLDAVAPAELEAWERAQTARRQAAATLDRAEAQQVERLRYQATLAERQFNRVDPDNRLVASELERRWESALRELRQAEEALARRRASTYEPPALTPEEHIEFRRLAPQLPELWRRPDVTPAFRKALLRCLIDKVVLRRSTPECVEIRIVWRGGETTDLSVDIAVRALASLTRGTEMEARVVELARAGMDDATIAAMLTKEGFRSARLDMVSAHAVKVVRLRCKVLRAPWLSTPRRVPGLFTVAQLARRIGVSPHWLHRRIRNGTIDVVRCPISGRWLFPDTDTTLSNLERLKNGQIERLHFDSLTDEQGYQHA
jgi:DNA invertase Pin-like site-specific DNA recombinase